MKDIPVRLQRDDRGVIISAMYQREHEFINAVKYWSRKATSCTDPEKMIVIITWENEARAKLYNLERIMNEHFNLYNAQYVYMVSRLSRR